MDLNWEDASYTNLPQDRDKWWTVVKKVTSLRCHEMQVIS